MDETPDTGDRPVVPEALAESLSATVGEAVRRVLGIPERRVRAPLLTVEEAAAHLGLTPGALRKAVERGQVKAIRIGRRLRFRVQDLPGADS